MAPWRLQIYLVSDPMAQELITALVGAIENFVVEPVTGDFDHFVVIESCGALPTEGVHRLLRSIDPGVKLIHTSTAEPVEPVEPTAP